MECLPDPRPNENQKGLFEFLAEIVESNLSILNEKNEYLPYTFNFFKNKVKEMSMSKFALTKKEERTKQLAIEIFIESYKDYQKYLSKVIEGHGKEDLERFIKNYL